VSLDTADHLLSVEADAEYAGAVLGAWAMRYVRPRKVEEAHEETHGHKAVVRIGKEHYRTEVLTDGHVLVSDEPPSLGGTDLGPTPYNLLLAGLGACTAITIRMYADRKEWPVEAVEVHLEHQKVAPDETDCTSEKPGKIDLITREVILVGDLDEKQRARLLDIADRCPVHRTLEAGPCIRTTELRAPENEP
jgi:putative redox protein